MALVEDEIVCLFFWWGLEDTLSNSVNCAFPNKQNKNIKHTHAQSPGVRIMKPRFVRFLGGE